MNYNSYISGYVIIVTNQNKETLFYQRSRRMFNGNGKLTDMPLLTGNIGKAKRYKTRSNAEKAIEKMVNFNIVKQDGFIMEVGKITIKLERITL